MSRKDAIALKRVVVKQPTGTQAKVLEIMRRSKGGMTSIEARAALPDLNPQTVTDAVNRLVKQGWLKDSGKRRAAGSRRTVVYVFEAAPTPRQESAPAKIKQRDLKPFERLNVMVHGIDDHSVVAALERWKDGKSKDAVRRKALQIIKPLVGSGPSAFGRLRDQWFEDKKAAGDVIGFDLGSSKK